MLRCSCVTEICGLNPSRVSARLWANRADGAGQVAAGLPGRGEGEPFALVIGPAQRARAAQGEAPGERRRGPQLHPAAGVALALKLGPLAPPAEPRVDAQRRRCHPADAHREVGGRPVAMRVLVVAAFVPGGPRVQRGPRVEPVHALDAEADIAVRGLFQPRPRPVMNPAQQQAYLAGPADQPARPDMAGDGHPVERALPVFPAREVAAGAQPPLACPGPRSGVAQRVLVFPPQPGRDADARGGQLVLRRGGRGGPGCR